MDAINLILSDARGLYLPRDFAEAIMDDGTIITGWTVPMDDLMTVLDGPETEWYCEAWDSILTRAAFTRDGHTWHLWQDGDLFMICDEMLSDDEYREFFGESRS